MRNFLLQMGAPRWPPSPPAARSAPGSPWRSSIYAGKFTLGAREDAAGALGAHAVVVDDEGAVDDHVGDAGRVAVRVGIGGLVLDGGGVEDREVGEVAGLHQAALAQADALGRHAGHLRSEEHTSELQSPCNLVCRLLLEKKKYDRRANCTRGSTYRH